MSRALIILVEALVLGALIYREQYVFALILLILFLLFEQLRSLANLRMTPPSLIQILQERFGRERAQMLQGEIHYKVDRYEETTGKRFTQEARDYLFNVIYEGFLRGNDELLIERGINLHDLSQFRRAVDLVILSLNTILQELKATPSNEITISKFSEPIGNNGREVWPFYG